MTDNGSKNRPVRTLTVKNFSVIKEAKLEFGKITVLIGPQASGKSLLAKLAYFFVGEITGIAVESLLDRSSWDDFLQAVGREFNERFVTAGWLRTNTKAEYSSRQFTVRLRGIGDPVSPEVQFSFSDEFKNLYRMIGDNPAKQLPTADRLRNELRGDLFVELNLLQQSRRTQSNTYIPAGRALFTEASKSIAALQNPDMDQITRRFAGLIAWDSRWKAGYLTTDRNVLQEVEQEMYRIAGGAIAVAGGIPRFLTFGGYNLPLSAVSSGTLELLPMFNVVDQLACFQEDIHARTPSAKKSSISEIINHSPRVFLEEPEAHIFPKTQYELVRLFAAFANDQVLDFDWVITTHSPYILTAFNSLIEAWRVGNKPGKREKVAAMIPEQYWIDENDFAAYTIRDGVLIPIFEKETEGKEGSGLIDGDYLDSVSDQLGSQFEKLLDIEYAD